MAPHPDVAKIFPLPLIGSWDLAGEVFTTSERFIYNDEEKGIYLEVPPRRTDFSSVPRAGWWWFPKTQYPAAGLVHDQLFDEPFAIVAGVRKEMSRGECDDVWRRILHLSGCRKSKRVLAWSVLRMGSWRAWNDHRQRDKARRGLGSFL